LKRTTAAVSIVAAFVAGVVAFPLFELWRESTRASRYRGEESVIEIIVAVLVVAFVAWDLAFDGFFKRRLPLALLSVALALPASAAEPRCAGSLGVWTATATATGANQSVVVGSRAEGGCNVAAGFRGFARVDASALPGTSVSLTDPATFRNVAAVEGWIGLSKPVVGPFSLAVFGGVQRALAEDVKLGLGAATTSLCAGGRVDHQGAVLIGGLCSRYAAAQQTAPRRDGPALVGTAILPVKSGVSLAANGALMRGDYVFLVGPAISIGGGK
jgi:hypothetical protein